MIESYSRVNVGQIMEEAFHNVKFFLQFSFPTVSVVYGQQQIFLRSGWLVGTKKARYNDRACGLLLLITV